MSNIEQSENQAEQDLNSSDPLSYTYNTAAFFRMIMIGPLGLNGSSIRDITDNHSEGINRFFSLTRPDVIPDFDTIKDGQPEDFKSDADNYQKRIEATTRVFSAGGHCRQLLMMAHY